MYRTKYDAPAPRVREVDIDKYEIWRRHKLRKLKVSKDLESRVLKSLKRNEEIERI